MKLELSRLEILMYRFSNKKTLKKFEPTGNISKKLYDISEKIRCEKIVQVILKV